MKRSEFFVTRGRGHWAKCRKEFRCEFSNGLRCLYRVKPGDAYLKTDVPMYPDAPADTREGRIMRRYCFHCADGELHHADQHAGPDSRKAARSLLLAAER